MTACDQLKIAITAKAALGPVADFRRDGPKRQGTTAEGEEKDSRPTFSMTAFVNALAEWIAVDDQVFFEIYIKIFRLLYII